MTRAKKSLAILGGISLTACIAGFIWSRFDPYNNEYAFNLFFFGWLASLVVVGYASTPSDSLSGKIAFGFVVIMVTGIGMKMLHLFAANVIIVVGLLGIFATYGVMWFGSKR